MLSRPSRPRSPSRPPGSLRAGIWAVAGLLALASACSVIRKVFPPAGPAPRPFNHEAHAGRGITCVDCHEGAQKEVHAGMPSKAFCMNCHDDLDKEKGKPLEKKVAWFLDEQGEPRWARFGRQKEEVKFSHKSHAGKSTCAECHGELEKNTGLLPRGPQRMSECTSCHEEKATARRECAACHTAVDRTWPPENHRTLWSKRHGACARDGEAAATANACALCHPQTSCITCHQTVLPEDHTEFWRLRAHGLAASLDRSRCLTCHASDSCVRCHRSASPVSHTAGWNAPRDNHCLSCHLPLQSSGSCAVCHQMTPGHALAPRMPPWHNPGLNCRACHGISLKHPDNGDSCTACHR